MVRHFLQLYVLIVLALAAVSWGQERLWQAYAQQTPAEIAADNPSQLAALKIVESQLRALPESQWRSFVRTVSRDSGVDLEIFEPADIAGRDTLDALSHGGLASMKAESGQRWLLKQVGDELILAFRYRDQEPRRSTLDWVLAFIFYAAIALVIMAWLWPLRRDLRTLERATSTFGDRNWSFHAPIGPRSQVHSLTQSFRRMAARIDGLIRSHQDMSNAMSHEIKTPLSRMRFEVEMARTTSDPQQLVRHLDNIDTDIAELNSFVMATLDYAILERAEVALNLGSHDMTVILPAIAESVSKSAPPSLRIHCEVDGTATRVVCDAHLLETVVRNLLYNATRYARSGIRVRFQQRNSSYELCVDDDGPGIAESDRVRVFESFVRLDQPAEDKHGFGLGLAIVKCMVEWQNGTVVAEGSDLGGARFRVEWPQGQEPQKSAKGTKKEKE
jgi:two-component system, OmpR family, sensor kinase